MLKTGLYRNRQGAEMYVLGQAAPILIPIEARTAFPPVKPQFDFLGGSIYLAENRHELFGDQHYLVTEEDMKNAGYELIRSADEEERTPPPLSRDLSGELNAIPPNQIEDD